MLISKIKKTKYVMYKDGPSLSFERIRKIFLIAAGFWNLKLIGPKTLNRVSVLMSQAVPTLTGTALLFSISSNLKGLLNTPIHIFSLRRYGSIPIRFFDGLWLRIPLLFQDVGISKQ